jgi:pimeloyl-ACP methyl ester carboxylesterase
MYTQIQRPRPDLKSDDDEGPPDMLTKALAVTVLSILALAAWTWIAAWRAVSRFPPQGVFAPVAGGRLHLRDMGPRDAPPHRTIVMIHGASCNHMALVLPLAEPLLAVGFRVIAIDRPGHGHSDRPGGRADADPVRQAALIAEALRAVGAGEAIFLAHSFAGAVATVLAINHAPQVKGLMLLGPATHPWPGGIAWYYHPGSWPMIDLAFSNTLPVAGFAMTAQAGVEGVFAPQRAPADYIVATELPLMVRPANFRANAQDVAGLLAHVKLWSSRYGEIRQPVTIISGDADTIVSTTIHTEALARQLPDARRIVLPGAGHVPHHADTARVVAEMVELSGRAAGE